MINLMLAQKGGNYLDADGNVNITSDEMVEVLTYIKGMQDTGAFATVPGGQPDNEEAYPFYNSGDYAAQIMADIQIHQLHDRLKGQSSNRSRSRI